MHTMTHKKFIFFIKKLTKIPSDAAPHAPYAPGKNWRFVISYPHHIIYPQMRSRWASWSSHQNPLARKPPDDQ